MECKGKGLEQTFHLREEIFFCGRACPFSTLVVFIYSPERELAAGEPRNALERCFEHLLTRADFAADCQSRCTHHAGS